MVLEVSARLPSLRAMVSGTGLGICYSMGAKELATVMRSAYDPSIATTIQETGPEASGVTWENCGPLDQAQVAPHGNALRQPRPRRRRRGDRTARSAPADPLTTTGERFASDLCSDVVSRPARPAPRAPWRLLVPVRVEGQ